MPTAGQPITSRHLHELRVGHHLEKIYFDLLQIPNPEGPCVCTCAWDSGHQEHCDIVAAHALLMDGILP